MEQAEQDKRRISWYRTKVDRKVLAELNQRSDILGSIQTIGYLTTLVATGTLAWWTTLNHRVKAQATGCGRAGRASGAISCFSCDCSSKRHANNLKEALPSTVSLGDGFVCFLLCHPAVPFLLLQYS